MIWGQRVQEACTIFATFLHLMGHRRHVSYGHSVHPKQSISRSPHLLPSHLSSFAPLRLSAPPVGRDPSSSLTRFNRFFYKSCRVLALNRSNHRFQRLPTTPTADHASPRRRPPPPGDFQRLPRLHSAQGPPHAAAQLRLDPLDPFDKKGPRGGAREAAGSEGG